VRLVAVDGTTLVVEGLDAVDGTPVLDVKVSQPPE
jgi:tRNA (Thr-GGU) A37 N-methylase